MANIEVKKAVARVAPTRPQPMMAELDPSRWFSRMMGFDPFREMMPLLTERVATFEPAFEVKETKEGYLFKADLPGVNLADIDVSVMGNRLQISGKREAEKEDKGDTYYMYERTYGSFTRAFTLPNSADATRIHADLRDGVLTVIAPKSVEALPKKINIASPAPDTKKV